MKKLLFMVAALAAFTFTSCNNDDDIQGLVNNGDMEEVTLTVGVDNGVKTKAATADNTLTGGYNLRYILEIYKDESSSYSLYNRTVQIFNGSNTPNVFTLSIPKNGSYKIVAWVDYTTKTGTGNTDEFYNTTTDGLKGITMKNNTIAAVNPAQDAYTISAAYTTGSTMSLTATRPFAQVNIFATDNGSDAWYNNLGNATGNFVATITYTGILSTFNAITQTFGASTNDVTESCSTAAASDKFTGSGTSSDRYFSGFVFADGGSTYDLAIEITATTANAGTLNPSYTITNVPLKRNYRTNISGDLLLGNATTFTITTDTDFGGDLDGNGIWNGEWDGDELD